MNDQTKQNILLIKKVFIIATLLFLFFISFLFFFKKTLLIKNQSSRPSSQNYFPSSQNYFIKTIGGTDKDSANSVSQTSDGGYIVAGGTKSFGAGKSDAVVIKLDSNGNISWAKTIGGSGDSSAFSVSPSSDGGYIVAGYTDSFGTGNSDIFVIKLDANGNIPGCSYLSSVNPNVSSYDIQANNVSISSENIHPSVSSISLSAITQNQNTINVCPSSSDR